MIRFALNETKVVFGRFNAGDTVTIEVFNATTSTSETLDTTSCTPLGSTGVFSWNFDNLTTFPTEYGSYLFIMTNTDAQKQMDTVILGGYIEDVILSRKMQTNKAIIAGDRSTVDVYDDNNTTPIHHFDVSSDKLTRTPS